MRSFRTFSSTRRQRLAAESAAAAQAAAEADAEREYEGKQRPADADQAIPEELLKEPQNRLDTWRTVDAEVEAFKSNLEKIWREGATFKALRQQSLFQGLWFSVAVAVVIGIVTMGIEGAISSAIEPHVAESTFMYTISPWIIALSGMVSGALTYGAWLTYKKDTLVTRTENKLVGLSNEISGRLISFLIEDGPDTINKHKDHIKIDNYDSVDLKRNCVNDMMIAWRKMQLTPYKLEPSWMLFKYVHIIRHNKKNRRPLFYLFSIGALIAIFAIPTVSAAFSIADIGLAPFLAAGVSYTLLSFSWRNYLIQRMQKLLDRIELEITYHTADSQKEPVEWKHVVARYDPTPDLADSLYSAHTFITDANRTGRRGGL